jgi:hypothetical protein
MLNKEFVGQAVEGKNNYLDLPCTQSCPYELNCLNCFLNKKKSIIEVYLKEKSMFRHQGSSKRKINRLSN